MNAAQTVTDFPELPEAHVAATLRLPPPPQVSSRDVVEIIATVLLALAAVATAWSHEAHQWHGETRSPWVRARGLEGYPVSRTLPNAPPAQRTHTSIEDSVSAHLTTGGVPLVGGVRGWCRGRDRSSRSRGRDATRTEAFSSRRSRLP